jgi:hypothetical protein
MRCASHVGGGLCNAFECAIRMGPVEIRGTIHEPLKGRMLKEDSDNTRRSRNRVDVAMGVNVKCAIRMGPVWRLFPNQLDTSIAT